MISKLQIRTVIQLLLLFLIIIRFSLISDGLELFVSFILSLFENPTETLSQLDYPTIDFLASVILIVIVPILLIASKNYLGFLNGNISLLTFVIIFIGTNFIFAPVITDTHPNFQHNIKTARFLPPLSKVTKVFPINEESSSISGNFSELKNRMVKSAVRSEGLLVDSLILANDSVIVYQGTDSEMLSINKFKIDQGIPITETKFFLFGTDELGRDIFSRVIYGSRISIFIGLLAVSVTLFVGIFLGFMAGFYGGYLDLIISRITDLFLTIPSIFFVIMTLAFFGNSLFAIIIVLGLSGWMSLFKVVKGEIAVIKEKDYFVTSKKLMLSKSRLVLKEILPVIVIPVVVNMVFQFSNVILAESSLSYLGLGAGLNYPSWGAMILSGQHYMSQGWWLMFFPGIVLIITLFAFNLFGEKIKAIYNRGDYQ